MEPNYAEIAKKYGGSQYENIAQKYGGVPVSTSPQSELPTESISPEKPTTGQFLAGELTGKPVENPSFMQGLVQNTVGSKGILGVIQGAAKTVGIIRNLDEDIKISNESAKLYSQNSRLLRDARKLPEQDPQRAKMLELVDMNNEKIGQLKGTQEGLGVDYNIKPSDVFASTARAVSTLAPVGAGLSTAAKVGISGGSGALASAGEAIGEGKTTSETLQDMLVGGTISTAFGSIPIVGSAIKNKVASGNVSSRIINSLIKPASKLFSYGKDPGLGVAREGIVANSLEELTGAISNKRSEVYSKIGQVLNKPSNLAKRVSTENLLAPLDDAIATASKTPSTNSALITRLKGLQSDLKGIIGDKTEINPLEATELKKTIGDLTKYTGLPSDDDIVNKSLQKIYSETKTRINKQVKELVPLNERYANLTSAEIASKSREVVAQRQALLGFSPQIAGVGSGLLAALATGGAAIPTIAVGLTAAGARKLFSSAAFKTRVASLLAKKEPAVASKLLKENPVLEKAIKDALPQTYAIITRSISGQ